MSTLAKSLTATRGAGLMLNIVIGAGLLSLPGLVVAQAGDHALWAWGLCALAAIPLLLVFVIMGRRFPDAGGIAHFARMAFGRSAYAVSSFIFLGAVAFGLPAIALTGGHYLAQVLPGNPAAYGAALVVAAAATHLVSTETAGRVSTAIASTVLISLVALIALGFSVIDWNGAAQSTAGMAELNMKTVFAPFMMIFFAFTGWEVAAGLSEEFKNPRRDFPRAMALSFIAACILYFAMAFVVQNVPVTGAHEAAFTSIAERALGVPGKFAVTLLASFIIFANLMGAIWAVSRMVFSLSREGYLPLPLKTNAKGTPVSAVALTACVLLLVLSLDWLNLLDIGGMLALAGQNFLLLYGISAIALYALSRSFGERVVAGLAIAIVAGLIAMQGASLYYPAALAAFGLLVGWATKQRRKAAA